MCSVVIITTLLLCLMTPSGDELKGYFIASNIDKMKLLEETPSPRIILIGGSNVAFSINSQIIEDSTEFNAINMGSHAGVGLNYLIKETIPYVKDGDIILISPEYSQFDPNLFFGGSALTQLLLINGELWPALKSVDWVDDLPLTFKTTVRNLIAKMSGGILKESYSRTKFNHFGDYIGHWQEDRVSFEPSFLTAKIDKTTIKKLHEFQRIIEQKGAKVLIISPCYPTSAYKMNKKWIKRLEAELKKEGLKMAPSECYVFDDNLFYDTEYHMTEQGTKERTNRIIENISVL